MEIIKSRFFPWVLLFILSLIPLFEFLKPGLPITHDGIDHVARIANFYQNLGEGNLIPRWAGNLNWGYGHPILMFLYPLPSYFASIFHFLGASFIDSVKLVFAVSFILSGLTMYLWVREFLGKEAGVAASILYLFAPYRFVDLYVRGAIGEHVAFIFPPLILYFLLRISKNKLDFFDKKFFLLILGGSFSLAGFILSHNAISLLFAPLIFFYVLFLLWQNRSLKLTKTFIALFAFGGLLSFFFWFPAFFEGKYTLRDIVTAGEYAKRFVNLKDLIYSPWGFGGTGLFSVQIGLVHLLSVASLPFVISKLRKNKKLLYLYLFTVLYFLFSIFLMLPQSNFLYSILTTLQKLQFPWRFLSVIVFTSSVMGGFLIYTLPNRTRFVTLTLIILASILLTANFWKANGFIQRDDSFFQKVYKGTTDTGESSPVWSVRFMEREAADQIEVIEGEAKIKKLSRTSTSHVYEINAKTDPVRIRENTLYFPGWNVFDRRDKALDLEFQDPRHRGLMTFYLPRGSHKVYAQFGETKLRLFADYASFASLLGLAAWGAVILTRRKLR